jgi:hypothetical protein
MSTKSNILIETFKAKDSLGIYYVIEAYQEIIRESSPDGSTYITHGNKSFKCNGSSISFIDADTFQLDSTKAKLRKQPSNR